MTARTRSNRQAQPWWSWSGILNREALVALHPQAKIGLGALLLGYSWYAGIIRGAAVWAFLFQTPVGLTTYVIMLGFQAIWTLGQWFTSSKPSYWYLFWLFPDALLTAFDFAERISGGMQRVAEIAGLQPIYGIGIGVIVASAMGALIGMVAARYGERLILDSRRVVAEA